MSFVRLATHSLFTIHWIGQICVGLRSVILTSLFQRFHNRIKENRGRLFDRLRDVSGVQGASAFKIIQQELSNILDNEVYVLTNHLIYFSLDTWKLLNFYSIFSVMDSDDETRIREEIELEIFGEEGNTSN